MSKYTLTPRVKVLAERLLARNSSINTERASILSTLMSEISGMPSVVKGAKVFSELVKKLPVHIEPDELIVGNQSSRPRSAVFHSQ